MIWKIELTFQAKTMLKSVRDRRLRGKLIDHIDGLRTDPEKQNPEQPDMFWDWLSFVSGN